MLSAIFLLSLLNISLCFGMEPDEKPEEHVSQEKAITLSFPKAYFRTDIIDAIRNIISHEKKQIMGALYRFTRYDIAQHIIEQKVDTSLVIDHDFQSDFCTALRLLCTNNVSIRQWATGRYNNMHNKFLVFKDNVEHKTIVITGSFNLTGQASERNAENIIILDDAETADQYAQEFCLLNDEALPITAEQCRYTGKFPKTEAGRAINKIPAGEQD